MENDLDILTRTLFGESEAGDTEDAIAIASVIMNRVAFKNWPNKVAAVCLQPYQFSCWNVSDPNRQRIMSADPNGTWYTACRNIALRALQGKLVDTTNGATHYYADYAKQPKWAKGHKACYVSSQGKYKHYFYNDIDTKPPTTATEALEQIRPVSQSRTAQAAQVGIGGAGVIGIVTQVSEAVVPHSSLIATIAQYAPWVLVAGLVCVVGYMFYARISDRAAGKR